MVSYAQFEDELIQENVHVQDPVHIPGPANILEPVSIPDQKPNCPICYQITDPALLKPLSECGHSFCSPCLTHYFQHLIDNAQAHIITCPNCSTDILRSTIASLVSQDYVDKYDKFILRNNLLNNPYARFCPQVDCEGYDMGSLKKKKLTCNICKFEYCFFCAEKWHGSGKCEKKIDEDFEQWAVGHNVKFCPKCKRRVEKRGGCPNMTCLCGNTWCWRCGGMTSDPDHEVRCYLGRDIWNTKRGIIILLIFAPILIYFIPAVIAVILFDFMNEGEEGYWIIANRRYFYPLLIIFSPAIEVIAIFLYVMITPCIIAKSYYRNYKVLVVGCVIIGVIALASAVIMSFVCSVVGVVLLVLKILAKFVGKEVVDNNFYPQIFE
jgi:hypothetical protein